MIPLFKVAMETLAVEMAADTMRCGYVGQGPRVEEFEGAMGQLVEAAVPPLATNAGTSALWLALQLADVNPGDEVISTPMTCAATNAPIELRGARVQWADVDPNTGLINPTTVAQLISHRTKAIIAVDYGGRACAYDELRSHGLPVIEDAAHALLARYRGKSIAQSGGDYVCWSFQAIKHLTTVDGGALLAPAAEMERGRLLRWYGLNRRSTISFRAAQDISEMGGKWHMHDVAASIGLGNLPGAPSRVAASRRNAEIYRRELAGVTGIQLPPADADSSWWLYTLLVGERERFIEYMASRGIETGQAHARNDLHSAFAYARRPLPGVDAFAARQVSIPCGWWVGDKERAQIIGAVQGWSAALAGRKQIPMAG